MNALNDRSNRSTKLPITSFDTKDLVFQTIGWHAEDVDFRYIIGEENLAVDCHKYVIKAFGSTSQGETVSVTITNFAPFFYIRIKNNDDFPLHQQIKQIRRFLVSRLPHNVKNGILSMTPVKRKDFWGF